MTGPIICTIIAKNYEAQAACLTESFLRHHPQGTVEVLRIEEADRLNIPDLPAMRRRYKLQELCTAVKPFFLEYLLEKKGLERVCYFDPDIYFYRPMDTLWSELKNNSIVLTPHLLGPLNENYRPNEFSIFRQERITWGSLDLATRPKRSVF